ncbi:MAG: DUF58 domain-containing protein [Lentisphaeria bacterium]|nr:DUF58 domain-containing protein [Lentisphaeria bacterium]
MKDTGELLAKVRKIEIKTKRMVDELTGGAYHSVFKGRGIEFSEVREYTFDDDVRDIDWNVTARTNVPHIKKYSEERELTVILAVDISASGLFGSAELSKREKMTEGAALLALSAIRNNDKVGLLLFTEETELYLPPRSGRTHGLRLIRELLGAEGRKKGTNIASALETLAKVLKKRAVIFLISDFIDGNDYEKTLKIVARKHDLVAMRVLDEKELSLPVLPGLELLDAESGKSFSFSATGKNPEKFRIAAEKEEREVSELCRRSKVDLIDVRCGEDLVRPLMSFFRSRKKLAR